MIVSTQRVSLIRLILSVIVSTQRVSFITEKIFLVQTKAYKKQYYLEAKLSVDGHLEFCSGSNQCPHLNNNHMEKLCFTQFSARIY